MIRNLRLLRAFAKNNWQQETVYFTNKIVGLFTPLMYVLSFLLFVTVLFDNVDSIAGYSEDEMFLLIFIGQLSFYSYTFWSARGSEYLDYGVNQGYFDYILIRPVSSLFFATWHRIQPFGGLLNFLGPMIPTFLIINWNNLNVDWSTLPFALVCFICGVLLWHNVQFAMSCVVFWTGRSKQTNLIVYAASSQTIPLEGFGNYGRIIFFVILPLYMSSVIGSLMLGKINPITATAYALLITIIFSIIKRIVWSKALRQYSSASS